MKYQSILAAATGFKAVSATIALDTGSQCKDAESCPRETQNADQSHLQPPSVM